MQVIIIAKQNHPCPNKAPVIWPQILPQSNGKHLAAQKQTEWMNWFNSYTSVANDCSNENKTMNKCSYVIGQSVVYLRKYRTDGSYMMKMRLQMSPTSNVSSYTCDSIEFMHFNMGIKTSQ